MVDWLIQTLTSAPWKVAMICIAPFMRGRPMLRTWVALFAASVATYFVHTPLGYLVIDAVAASLIVARPSGLAQKAIGALFVSMVLFDLGFYLSPQADENLFRTVLTGIGWIQWLILGAWGGYDLLGRYRDWNSGVDRPPVAHQRRIR
jgi:hypothetical protein